jgi:phosphohistidine phosphatase SixA
MIPLLGRLALGLLLLTGGPPVVSTPAATAVTDSTVVVYLVRHAEKVDDSRDPALSQAGKVRAEALAHALRSAGITHVWTTDFIRTRATAAPTAAELGLQPSVYDPFNLPAFAAQLMATPGRHLVVGHSNTTPALVKALGGDPVSDIPETEYDRLYVVVIEKGSSTSVLLRYGSEE